MKTDKNAEIDRIIGMITASDETAEIDKIIRMITASDSVGILHTRLYRTLSADGDLYNTAYNDLNILSEKIHQECSDEGDDILIYDSIICIDAEHK